MTTDDHDPEPAIVKETIEEAERTVQRVAILLQLGGWDSIVISIARAIEIAPGEFRAPGATATVIDTDRVAPIMPQIAEVMRKQAAILDASAEGAVATSGYIHDQTNYASGMREWPR